MVQSVAFSPDGRRLVAAIGGSAVLMDPETGKPDRVMQVDRPPIGPSVFSPDGRFVAAGQDRAVHLWDAQTGELIWRLRGHTSGVGMVAFSPDGALLASGAVDNIIRIWEIRTGGEIAALRGHTHGVTSLSYSPDGSRIASAGHDGARVWDVGEAFEATSRPLGWQFGSSYRSAYSRDGSLLATAGWAIVRLWDVESGRLVRAFDTGRNTGITGLTFGPDDRSVWIADEWWRRPDLMVVDAQTGRTGRYDPGHSSTVRHLAASRDGRLMATGSEDGTVRVFDATTRSVRRILSGHVGGARVSAFDAAGRRIATLADDGTVRIWDVASGGLVLAGMKVAPQPGKYRTLDCLTFSPDGRHLIAGNSDGTARVWDARTGEETLVLRGHSGGVLAVAYLDAGGGRIVTGGEDNTIKFWDPRTGECLFTLRGHGSFVTGLAVHPDGHQVVSSSHDQSTRVWESAPWPVGRPVREGLARVEGLFEQGLSADRVLRALRADESIAPSVRRAAIAVAERIGGAIERESTATALTRHALSLERLGRLEEARDLYYAVDLDNNSPIGAPPASDSRLLRHAAHRMWDASSRPQGRRRPMPETLAALGRMCERVEKRTRPTPDELYDLACFHALLHSLRGPSRLDASDEGYGGRPSAELAAAAESLRKAVEAGWSDADQAERDADLAPLRDREDFRRLIAALRDRAFPADPFAR